MDTQTAIHRFSLKKKIYPAKVKACQPQRISLRELSQFPLLFLTEAGMRQALSFWPPFDFKEKCGLWAGGRQASVRSSSVFVPCCDESLTYFSLF